jgi:hypothetical protein
MSELDSGCLSGDGEMGLDLTFNMIFMRGGVAGCSSPSFGGFDAIVVDCVECTRAFG